MSLKHCPFRSAKSHCVKSQTAKLHLSGFPLGTFNLKDLNLKALNFSSFNLGTMRQWHWISSALSLFAMLMFAFTGVTLNHASDISADIQVTTIEAALPGQLTDSLIQLKTGPLPIALRRWLRQQHDLHINISQQAEWSEDEIYLQIPRPGGDAWLSIDLTTGELLYELTQRGPVAYLNDLHKGRNTGQAWFWFIDVFAVACMVFCITGLLLLYRQANPRPSTWPMVGLGVVIPLLLIIVFVHP